MNYYKMLYEAIIRPPRAKYETSDLGPSKFLMPSLHENGKSMKVQRTEFVVINARGNQMVCSHFEPLELER